MSTAHPIRVAVFIDSITYGGAERATATLLRHLDRDRWSPVLFTHADPGIERLREEVAAAGVPVRVVRRMPDGVKGGLHALQFARLLRLERVELLHVQLRWPLTAKFAFVAGLLAGVPAVLATVHCVDPDVTMTRPTALQQRLLGRRVSRYIGVSRYVQQKLARQLPWPADRIVVVYNGVDPPPPAGAPASTLRATLAGPQTAPVVFAASNLFPVKGVDVLIDAAALVPTARFALAGEGPERTALERQIAGLDIGDRVTLLGWREDAGDLMRAADVFVVPSRGDGLSLSLLEALAVGTPVVITRVGGLPEAIEDGVNGLIVDPDDPPALAAAIRSLLADAAMRERLAAAGQQAFTERFSADAMAAGIEAVYESVLQGPGSR
jgi:glycosyltransferase involved in cell wall biosynthesis